MSDDHGLLELMGGDRIRLLKATFMALGIHYDSGSHGRYDWVDFESSNTDWDGAHREITFYFDKVTGKLDSVDASNTN